jgi:hypothetical protein
MTRRNLANNRAASLKVLKAYVSAIERIKADKNFALKVIGKNFKTTCVFRTKSATVPEQSGHLWCRGISPSD